MASGHMNRVKRPDTWLHRPMLQNVKKVLANPEPSTQLADQPHRLMPVRWDSPYATPQVKGAPAHPDEFTMPARSESSARDRN